MSDRDDLKALLTRWGAPYRDEDQFVIIGRGLDFEDSEKVKSCCMDMTATFRFDTDGGFIEVGIFE